MARQSLIPGRVKNTGIDLVIAATFIGGGILAVGFLNKRFGILDKFVQGVGSLGFKIGEATAVGLGSIPKGLVTGAQNYSVQAGGTGKLGLDFQTAYQNLKDNLSGGTAKEQPGLIPNAYGDTGTPNNPTNQTQGGFAELITAIEKNPFEDTTRNLTSGTTFKNFSDLFKDIQAAPAGGATPKAPLNVADIIKQAGQRISQSSTLAQNKKIVNQYGTQTTKNPFGGFASANAQETTLQALIAANAKRYPQWFKVV